MATPIPINRAAFDATEIIDATSAFFSGNPILRLKGVSIDSRTISPGSVFIALRGVNDGHEFLGAAAGGKAAAAIVERGRSHNALPCFEVEDTLRALGALARHHLDRVRTMQALPV